ncbi:MAG: hypothetical protein M3Q29_15535 [Chloroflexota bacterium]|nr:hypothetical protein [Chloroflexota bacterium]
MKRYRVLSFDFDSGPSLLSQTVSEDWAPEIQEQHRENRRRVITSVVQRFGPQDAEDKLQGYIDLGPMPVSIVGYHNRFFRQTRDSFVIGAFYPALTGACALGERILNHLLLDLRSSYQHTPEYKEVYTKSSFDDWYKAIGILETWGVLLPDVIPEYKRLAEIRNTRAIHYHPEVETKDRELALSAISAVSNIIHGQFAGIGPQPWFIKGVRGVSFVRKEAETEPFVKHFYLPKSKLVSPYHRTDMVWNPETERYELLIDDSDDHGDTDVTDEEFARLYENRWA